MHSDGNMWGTVDEIEALEGIQDHKKPVDPPEGFLKAIDVGARNAGKAMQELSDGIADLDDMLVQYRSLKDKNDRASKEKATKAKHDRQIKRNRRLHEKKARKANR